MANFDHCQFGPLEMRAIFRERLLPGERVIGWAVAARNARTIDVAMVLVVSTVPIIGGLIAPALAGRFRRFIVLTDSRLMLFDPSANLSHVKKRSPLLNAPLHSVSIARTGKRGKYRVRAPGLGGLETFTIRGEKPRSLKRLVDAFELLAADSDAAGRLIDAGASTEQQPADRKRI